MKASKPFILTIAILLFASFGQNVLALEYTVPPPKDLQAAITGDGPMAWSSASSPAPPVVHLTWNDSPGLNYLLTKTFPDGRVMTYTIQSGISDPTCIMNGGTFTDSLVERGKTYIYKVKAFDSSMNYSAVSPISVTIITGEGMGCMGMHPISLNSSATNLSLALDWDNPDNKTFGIYVDGRLKKTTNKNVATIWPVFGSKHQIEVVETKDNTSSFIQSASACVKEPSKASIDVEKTYSGLAGKISWILDRMFD